MIRPPLRALPVLIGLAGACAAPSPRPPAASGEAARQEPPAPYTHPAPAWRPLFDGVALGAWRPINFGGEGPIAVEDGAIVLGRGDPLTGIVWSAALPLAGDYELALEAMRVDGSDFFCALTFPVGGGFASLIVGGWGGGLVGVSSIDGRDASENETTTVRSFTSSRWYAVRVQVTAARLRAFLDDDPVVDVPVRGRRFSVRPEVELSRPLGVAAYNTRAALRAIRWRPLD